MINFRGWRRSNATHRSISDPEARAHKGGTSMLAHTAHAISHNRHGFCLALTSYGNDERDAVPVVLDRCASATGCRQRRHKCDVRRFPSGMQECRSVE